MYVFHRPYENPICLLDWYPYPKYILWKWEIPKTSQDQWFQYSGCLIIDDLGVPHFRTPPYVLCFPMTFILCAKATAEPQRAESYAGRASPCKSTGGGCMGLGSQRLRSATEQWLLNHAWLMISSGKFCMKTIGKYRLKWKNGGKLLENIGKEPH